MTRLADETRTARSMQRDPSSPAAPEPQDDVRRPARLTT